MLRLFADHYDVKMPCHLILSKLADKCPSAVLAGQLNVGFYLYNLVHINFHFSRKLFEISVLDSLVDPLLKTINFKPKQDAVKQEVDRNEDMIRSALRAIASLNRIRYWKIHYMNETFFFDDRCILSFVPK